MSFTARYVYTCKEFVFVTEASTVQQNDSDGTKTQIITSHSSSDLLEICVKIGASWSAQDFRQTGVTQSNVQITGSSFKNIPISKVETGL